MNANIWKENPFNGLETLDLIDNLEIITAGHPDPLAAYLSYIPNSKSNFLEFTLQKFLSSPQYHNDFRYLKLWITYADSLDRPQDIYNFLLTRGIGKSCAVLYVALADIYESNYCYELAELAYLRAVISKALPFEKLSQCYSEFLDRKQGKNSIGQEISIEEVRSLPKLRELARAVSITPVASPQHTPKSERIYNRINISAFKNTPELEKLYHSPSDISAVAHTPGLVNGRRPLGLI